MNWLVFAVVGFLLLAAWDGHRKVGRECQLSPHFVFDIGSIFSYYDFLKGKDGVASRAAAHGGIG